MSVREREREGERERGREGEGVCERQDLHILDGSEVEVELFGRVLREDAQPHAVPQLDRPFTRLQRCFVVIYL